MSFVNRRDMRALILVVTTITLTRCIMITEDHYYINLAKQPGIEVLKEAALNLDMLENNEPIPVAYRLNRGSYYLLIETDESTYLPQIGVTIEPNDSSAFSIRFRRNANVAINGTACANYYPDAEDPLKFKFLWFPECNDDQYSKIVSFDILDDQGALLDELDLSFKLCKDGEYRYADVM